jgi:dihydrofolate synthase/folylpolyglutamate synthase
MLSYEETVAKLYGAEVNRGINLGLATIQHLCKELGSPERSYLTIHVAGTNGKGSVTTKIARALEFAGLRVGLYTSPHISHFQERIVVNEVPISQDEIVAGMAPIFPLGEKATFFEMTTALAFHHFREKKVDVAVIETGLGGRLDATNVVAPLLSVITSIGFDHQELLGKTLDAIAAEKAGIIKPGIPLVLGQTACLDPILERAVELNCDIYKAPSVTGFYDSENSATAHVALEVLMNKFPLTPDAIERGVACRPPRRFEKVGNAIFDVAHNRDGFLRLKEALALYFPERKFPFVIGMSSDKEIDVCLEIAASMASHITLVQAPTARGATPARLASALEKIGFKNYTLETDIERAVRNQREPFVVCGSFFIMDLARRCLLP